jgi:hypothetical protein
MFDSFVTKLIKILSPYRVFNSHGIPFLPQFVKAATEVDGATYKAYGIHIFGNFYVYDIEETR